MKKNEKKKTNKKLLSAFGMFMLSGAMLGTATYAWFTMSREVEVTGIKMTATVPEDLQISAGDITAEKFLNATDSFLVVDSDGKAQVPTAEIQWSNTVDMSQYYRIGRLIPASSDTGASIFYTPDATGVGKTVSASGTVYQAASGTNALSSGSSYMTTLHALANSSDAWASPSGATYSGAVTFANTNDDGYYVDVPVWIRTSSDEDVNISVDAYATYQNPDNKLSGAQVELYKAIRVAILDTSGNSTSDIIEVKDGSYNSGTIVNYYGTAYASGSTANGALSKTGAIGNAYKTYTSYDAAGRTDKTVATITGSTTSAEYGTPVKIWIRVWLEGEDPECWNQNAGQDFNISLKFSKIN
jgi:hypothetical protein